MLMMYRLMTQNDIATKRHLVNKDKDVKYIDPSNIVIDLKDVNTLEDLKELWVQLIDYQLDKLPMYLEAIAKCIVQRYKEKRKPYSYFCHEKRTKKVKIESEKYWLTMTIEVPTAEERKSNGTYVWVYPN